MKNFTIAIIAMILLSFLSPVVAMQPKDNEVSVMTPVIIEFNDKVDKKLLENNGGKIKIEYKLRPAVAASLPPKAIENLRKNPNIKSIVTDIEIHTMEYGTSYFSDWGIKQIGADKVHNSGIKGETINVAVLDTGADLDHPDLVSNIAYSYDFSGFNDPDASDRDGHGTHVAGTIGALLNSNGVVGVAPDVNLSILKVFTDSGRGSYSDVEEALEWCYLTHNDSDPNNDIQIVSMSLGSEYADGDPDFEDLVDMLYDVGILLVGAAGNSGSADDNVIYPARYKNVIAVAATDINNNKASFSSTGPAVEISAPGVYVRSTYLRGRYATMSGTSMATPHVAGTAALVIASGIVDENENGNINDEVRARLIGTAIDLGSKGRDSWYGYGLVDAEAATVSTVTLESIAVTPMVASIPKGLTQQYTATGTYSDCSTADITSSVDWTSSDTEIATIDSAGLATGVGEGNTDITASLGSVESNVATLMVEAPILQSITVMPDTATIEVDAKQQYMATGTYSDASTADITSSVTWASSDTTVAAFDSTAGLATGVGAGTTTITASSNSINDTATLTVTLALKSIAITLETASIPKGLTQQYTANGTYSDDTTADITSSVTWTSSNNTVATIDLAGLATGVGVGTTKITATLDSVDSNEAALTVTEPILQLITIMPDTATIEVDTTQQYTAEGTYSDGSIANITSSVAWASSDTEVATIDSTAGLATGVGAGTTTITASLNLISDTATLTVTAPSESTVSVKSITYSTEGGRDGNKHLSITVALQPVVSASVSINVNLYNDPYDSYTGTTGTDGMVTFKLSNAPPGNYTTNVTYVNAVGLTWDGDTPENGLIKY